MRTARTLRAAPVALVLLGLLPAAPAGAGSADTQSTAPTVRAARGAKAVERRLVACVNRERKRRGIRPLRVNAALGKAARYHARNMARLNFFAHDDPLGDGPEQRVARFTNRKWAVGENIHQYYPSVKKICSEWMASPIHRANILNRAYRAVGAGYSRSKRYRHLYVVVFGIPLGRR